MKKLLFFSGLPLVIIAGVWAVTGLTASRAHALNADEYTCQANGVFTSLNSGASAITNQDSVKSAKALAWLEGQLKTTSTITSQSTIQPLTDYAPNHTGAVDGTFTLNGATYATKNDAPLTVTSPAQLSNTYSGVVQGHVLTTPTPWRWIIQVYKKTSSGYVQVPKQALADAETGDFTIDLSDVASPPAGEWAFGILDAENSYAPYGIQWPSPDYYDGLEVQQKLVTDAIYDWSTTRAYANGTFHFDTSNNGKKLFRLVDTQSGDILAEYVQETGLIRSYELEPTDPDYGGGFAERSFVYDQAVALFAALSANNEALATKLTDGLLLLQEEGASTHPGAFVFDAPHLTPSYRDALIRTGAHAIATDALLAYLEKYPDADRANEYTASANAALNFIDTTLSSSGSTTGLYLGGFGDYSGQNGAFNGAATIGWASTEHNIDIWHTFLRAQRVLPSRKAEYSTKLSSLQGSIITKLYNTTEQRLNQGMTPSGPDTANPLDVNSWGAIQLYASGEYKKVPAALSQLELFTFTRQSITGYAPFYDSPGYPGAAPNVWFEGSFGVALAMLRTGNSSGYRTLINSLEQAQRSDGSFAYATDIDPIHEITNRKAVASTAWYILATTGRDALWNSCQYIPPANEPGGQQPGSQPGSNPEPSQPAPGNGTPAGGKDARPSSGALQNSDIAEDKREIAQNTGSLNGNKNSGTTPETPQQSTDQKDSNKDDEPQAERVVPIILGTSAVGIAAIWLAVALKRRSRS